jgi:hypothetical protein
MVDITGVYDMNDGMNSGLTIRAVDASGEITDGFVRNKVDFTTTPIHGRFEALSRTISFNVALFGPESFLYTFFYQGEATLNLSALGEVAFLSGSWHQQTLELDLTQKTVKVTTKTGDWLANNHSIEIH